MKTTNWLMVTTALGAGVLAGASAFAQDAQSPGFAVFDEIVVTATRRAESLQNVPLAVSALSGDALIENGFQTLQDIQYQFSGVQFGTSPNDAGFRLRGVGTAGGFSSSSEQNVATVVDNVVVPFGNPVASLGDIERIEVLKGPQGTQFGKNASSGVVNITTKRPTLGEFSGKAFASYAELDERNVNGSINAPLGETAAFSLYAFDRAHDGFIDNVILGKDWGDQHSYGFRGKLLWEPSSKLSVYLIGDWSKIKRDGPGQLWTLNRLPSLANPLMAARFGNLAGLGVTPGFDNELTVEEFDGFSHEQNFGLSMEVTLALGEYELSSVTAYRGIDQGPSVFAIDGSSVPIFTAQQTGVDQSYISEEIRLSSPKGSALEFTAGVYMSKRESGDDNDFNRAQLRPVAPFNPFIVNISAGQGNAQTDSESLAAFFDGTFEVAEGLRAIGGFRYQYDWVDALTFSVIDPAFPPAPPGPPVPGLVNFYTARPLVTGDTKKGGWSGRAGFEYEPSEDILLFATVARGYLGPTVTFSALTGSKSDVAPQTSRDITIGAKTQFLDRRVTLNGSVFFDKYKDLQTSVFDGFEFLTQNAGGFRANGFELDASLRATENLGFHASYTYSDTKFTDYITECPASVEALGAAAIAAACNAPGSTTTEPLFQAAGEPLSGAPKHSLVLGANVAQPIGESLVLDASTDVYYRSRVQYTVGNPLAAQSGYTTVGLNLGLGDADGAWRIGVFARNVFNEKFHAAVITLPFNDAGGYVNWNTREGRRTVGVSAQAKF